MSLYCARGILTGRIKIGTSKGVPKRLKTLQAHSPDDLELMATIPRLGHTEERQIQKQLKQHKHHNEWFEPHEEVLAMMKQLMPVDDYIDIGKILRHGRTPASKTKEKKVLLANGCGYWLKRGNQ